MLHFLGHLWGTKALHCMQNRAATISSSISSTHTILVLFFRSCFGWENQRHTERRPEAVATPAGHHFLRDTGSEQH